MYDMQQENGTDEAPSRDVRWEGRLIRFANQAKAFNDAGLDYRIIEISAAELARLIEEREGLVHLLKEMQRTDPTVLIEVDGAMYRKLEELPG